MKKLKDSISITWNIRDVIERGKNNDIIITEQEAREILAQIEHNHDCNLGVNWDVIDTNIDLFFD